ncbi:MAG: hypothetical protein AUK55_10830 [Syntrophobacteraceae bacterium CG2_30_61_12]|nr:MAG: hypothetical protein AUK55_10830 [Syntrophobacteraceae bacterium CG2_30_61_12]PIU30926.1 MAG: hypothetical protein COT06_10930 [Syntrophobacteraceae bacterium CG07_land_8_20_14_0_80_61_8]
MGAARDRDSRANGHQMEYHKVRVCAALPDLCGDATVAGSCQVAPLGRNLTYGGHHATGVAVFLPRNRSSLMSNIQDHEG